MNKSKKIGTQGYCMGGPLVVRTAAAVPNRVGAGASFHGGGPGHDKPGQPASAGARRSRRACISAIASNDDMRQPDAKDKLKEAFAAAKAPRSRCIRASLHGWCVSDMPLQNGQPIYNKADAERAWGKLMALYKATLA